MKGVSDKITRTTNKLRDQYFKLKCMLDRMHRRRKRFDYELQKKVLSRKKTSKKKYCVS